MTPEVLWEWAIQNDPGTTLKIKNEFEKGHNLEGRTRPLYFWQQILFTQNTIANLIFGVPKEHVFVMGMHHSKGVTLPVMQFEWGDFVFTMRYNYQDWHISVRSPKTMERVDFLGLFNPDVEPTCFQLPVEYRYGAITANEYVMSSQFTCMICGSSEEESHHAVWAFFWIIRQWWREKYEDRFGNPPIVPVPDF